MHLLDEALRPEPEAENDTLFRTIFERAVDGIAIIAPDGTYLEQNDAHARLTGLSGDDLRGLTPAVHLGESAFARVLERLQSDGHFFGEVESTDASGVVRRVELSAFAVLDRSRRVLAYVGAKRDVSERRAADLELRRRFAQLDATYRLTAAIAQAPDLDALFDLALDCLGETLRPDRAAVLLSDDEGVMRFRAWRGISNGYRAQVEGHSPWAPDEPAPATLVVSDVAAELPPGELRDAVTAEGIAAVTFVPLAAHGALLGKFMLYFDAPRRFDAEELRLVENVAGHIAIEIVRGRAELALARRQREFEALAENSPDIICRFDRQLRHLYVNRAIECVTGRAREEMFGRTNAELGMPDPLVSRWDEMLRSVFDQRTPCDREFTFPTPAGARHYQSRAVVELEADGVVQTVLVTTRDITELKRAEQQQRLLAEVGAAFAAGEDEREAVAAVARLVGASVADGCIVDLTRPDGTLERFATGARDPQRAARLAALAARYPLVVGGRPGAAPASATGALLLLDDLGDRWLMRVARDEQELALWQSLELSSAICAPLRARGRALGVLTLLGAKPEPAYTQQEVEYAAELAGRIALGVDNMRLYHASQEASRTKSDFMATMSHELRTPLNAIMGYTELLHMHVGGTLTEAQEQHVGRIRASADHLLTVIEEILTFSRAEAGKEVVHVERFDASTLACECGSMVEATARARGVAFTISAPAAPLPLKSDPVKVRQVLLNLLGNAVKFTDAGTVTLAVSATPDGHVLFAVEDSGCGIASEHLDRIFEPFWQVQGGATRRNGGTGLGLTVSRQLVQLLGGELRVSSRLGEGSRFEVRLPG